MVLSLKEKNETYNVIINSRAMVETQFQIGIKYLKVAMEWNL